MFNLSYFAVHRHAIWGHPICHQMGPTLQSSHVLAKMLPLLLPAELFHQCIRGAHSSSCHTASSPSSMDVIAREALIPTWTLLISPYLLTLPTLHSTYFSTTIIAWFPPKKFSYYLWASYIALTHNYTNSIQVHPLLHCVTAPSLCRYWTQNISLAKIKYRAIAPM